VAQQEAAQVWNCCMETHKAARLHHERWPGRTELQKATKGRFALHSQSVQMVVHAFLANVLATRQLRQTFPQMKMRYPYKTKRFYPVSWPAQAVSRERGRVVLPMGKGQYISLKAKRGKKKTESSTSGTMPESKKTRSFRCTDYARWMSMTRCVNR
jgi:hypothetical protein